PDTDYKTGTEFHVEYALMKYFSKHFAFGLVGYNYRQLTGDSGSGAVLGDFKGRTNAIGPQINYNFELGPHHVATQLRWLREYDVDNRTKGDAVFFQAAIPLGGAGH
ncbi:MAG: SphA family protein, partial [Hyphomicrobiaceae bacterium]